MKFVGNSIPEYPSGLTPSSAQHVVDKAYADLFIPNTFLPQAEENLTSCTRATNSWGLPSTGTNVPAITMTTGTLVRVSLYGQISHSVVGMWAQMGVALSGASGTVAAGTNLGQVLGYRSPVANYGAQVGTTFFMTVTAGSNTFTVHYNSITTGATATFLNRGLIVERMN